MQIVLSAAKANKKVAIYLFDESKKTYLARGNRVGMDLSHYLQRGSIEIAEVDPTELSPGEFAAQIRRHVEHDGVGLIVIDSLNGYITSMTSERFLLAQMHELLSYLTHRSVTSILTAGQSGIANAVETTPFELTYLSDIAILLRYFEASGQICRAISVLKNRFAAHEATIREFDIGENGIRVGEPLRQFRGVLTGNPEFEGMPDALLRKNDGEL